MQMTEYTFLLNDKIDVLSCSSGRSFHIDIACGKKSSQMHFSCKLVLVVLLRLRGHTLLSSGSRNSIYYLIKV